MSHDVTIREVIEFLQLQSLRKQMKRLLCTRACSIRTLLWGVARAKISSAQQVISQEDCAVFEPPTMETKEVNSRQRPSVEGHKGASLGGCVRVGLKKAGQRGAPFFPFPAEGKKVHLIGGLSGKL